VPLRRPVSNVAQWKAPPRGRKKEMVMVARTLNLSITCDKGGHAQGRVGHPLDEGQSERRAGRLCELAVFASRGGELARSAVG
jgi:hypothetical protein